MTTFNDVFKYFNNSCVEMGSALNCSRNAIHQWHGKIPYLRTFQIEVVTGGAFKARDMLAGSDITAPESTEAAPEQ